MESQESQQIIEQILHKIKVESTSVDWTEDVTNSDSIGSKIAALATSGGGLLIIGITDKLEIAGIEDRQLVVSKIGQIVRNCMPSPNMESPNFIEYQGKTIAFFRIIGLGGSLCAYR